MTVSDRIDPDMLELLTEFARDWPDAFPEAGPVWVDAVRGHIVVETAPRGGGIDVPPDVTFVDTGNSRLALWSGQGVVFTPPQALGLAVALFRWSQAYTDQDDTPSPQNGAASRPSA